MKPEKDIEHKLEQLADAIENKDSFVSDVMNRIENCPVQPGNVAEASSFGGKTGKPNSVLRRILMKNTVKFTAAAIILIATFLSLTLLDKTVTPAQAVQQMRNAMNTVTWMHCYADTEKITGTNSENWLSPSLGIDARLNDDGGVRFSYFKDKETQIYDPNTNTIIFSAAADNNPWYNASSATQYLDLIIESLNDNDHATMTTQQGSDHAIYEITIPRGDPPGNVGTEIWQLTADRKSNLLSRMELEGWDETGRFIKVANFEFDYPETGPTSIYELGVPQTAVVIDKRPSDDVKMIINRYERNRKNEPTHYTALILYTRQENGYQVADEATLFYTDGTLQRKEVLSIRLDFMDAQRKGESDLLSEMGDTLDSMQLWWGNREHLRRRLSKLYDGQYLYKTRQEFNVLEPIRQKNTFDKLRRKHYTPESCYFSWMGVGGFFRLDNRNPEITLIENEYSVRNGLVCFQKLDVVDENNPESIKFRMPHGRRYKRLCYLNPGKDYICCRMETYLIQDKHWEKVYPNSEKFLVKNPDSSIEFTQREVREITEYGQTPCGKWYPKVIEWRNTIQLEDVGIKDYLNIIKIYLDTEREIPEDIYDPESFRNYLSE